MMGQILKADRSEALCLSDQRVVVGGVSSPVRAFSSVGGEPVSMTAGLVTLSLLNGRTYGWLENPSSKLEEGLLAASKAADLEVAINRIGSMVDIFFGSASIRNFTEVKGTNHKLYPRFHRTMFESGIYLPPSPFETVLLSTVHAVADFQKIADADEKAFRGCAR